MLLILWDWECCDAAAGRESVLVLVGGEEGRPLGGRLAPTPCPDRSSDDDRSPRLSERRTPICRGSPKTRTLERHQVRATQAPNSLVSSWINAGYGDWVCLVVSLLGGSPCPDSRRPVAISRGRLPVGEGPFVTRGERSVASCQAGRSHSTGNQPQPIDSPWVVREIGFVW